MPSRASTSRLLAVLFFLAPIPAIAAASEDGYVAARDKYIATFKREQEAGAPEEQLAKKEEAARAALEKQLIEIVGAVAVKGFPAPRKLNLETLIEGELGFGQLDGLIADNDDGKGRVLVTTEGLLKRWLAAHEKWWEQGENVPQEIAAALKSEAFYTQAISSDASVARFAELPLTRGPEAGPAYAMLVQRRQDIGPAVPDEVIVAAMQGGRLFVLSAPAGGVTAIKACDAVWRDYEARAQKLLDEYQASGNTDEKKFDEYTRLQDEGDGAFRRCFAERAKGEPFFAALTKQAQGLIEALPAR